MFCSQCGAQNLDNSRFCASCGQTFSGARHSSAPVALVDSHISAPTPEAQTSGKAVASLICGFFSFAFPAAIVAIVLGHISRSEIRRSNGKLKGNGMALTGLIFGYSFVAVLPVLIIAAIVIPNLLRSRQAANEASAVGGVRTIWVAEISYASMYPKVGYTCRISDLAGQGGSPRGAGLIDKVLGAGTKSGYNFTLTGCSSSPIRSSWWVPCQTGTQAFCASQDGVIKYERTGSFEDCRAYGNPLR
jgi:type IV pilus assembly protein PilA